MNSLPEMITDVEFLLAMETEELAASILPLLSKSRQQAGVHLGNYSSSLFSANIGGHCYDTRRQDQIILDVSETWNWLEVQALLIPAPGTNGSHGWRVLSRKAPSADLICRCEAIHKVPPSSARNPEPTHSRQSLVRVHPIGVRCRSLSSHEGGRGCCPGGKRVRRRRSWRESDAQSVQHRERPVDRGKGRASGSFRPIRRCHGLL